MGITVRALRAVKQLCRSRIALIGGIAPGFNDLYFDERKLLRRFPGMEYDRLPEFDDILERAKRYDAAELAAQADAFDAAAHSVHPKAAKHHLLNVRMLRAYKEFAAVNRFDALAVSCWPKFQAPAGLLLPFCSIVARPERDGLKTAGEGAVLCAVSMLLLQSLTQQSAMLMDCPPSTPGTIRRFCGTAAPRPATSRSTATTWASTTTARRTCPAGG
jgi:L-fucose isomerase-like protein